MTVLATAGHVDHGKSTFVNFITGQETDRLKEEKTRGLTINLGYTYFEFKNKIISIVDVPGHVDYFKNTVAGFANVDGPCDTSAPVQVCTPRNALPESTLYIPLQFWFTKNSNR